MVLSAFIKGKEAVNEALSLISGKHPFWMEAKDDLRLIGLEILKIKDLFLKNYNASTNIVNEEELLRIHGIHSPV